MNETLRIALAVAACVGLPGPLHGCRSDGSAASTSAEERPAVSDGAPSKGSLIVAPPGTECRGWVEVVAERRGTAAENEALVARVLEQAVATLPGVDALHSRSDARGAVVSLLGDDPSAIRSGVAGILSGATVLLPDDVTAPVVARVEPHEGLALVVAALGAHADADAAEARRALRRAALEQPGVDVVAALGPPIPRVEVVVEPARLGVYGMTRSELARQLRAAMASSPLSAVEDLGDVPLRTVGARLLPLSSVAAIRLGDSLAPVVRYGGEQAVVLALTAGDAAKAAEAAVEAQGASNLAPTVRPKVLGTLATGCPAAVLDERVTGELAWLAVWLPTGAQREASTDVAGRIARDPAGSQALLLVGAPPLLRTPTVDPDVQVVVPRAQAAGVLDLLRETPGIVAREPFAPGVSRIQARLQHESLEVLADASRQLADALVRDGLTTLPAATVSDEITVTATTRARALGLATSDLARAYRHSVDGEQVGSLQDGPARLPVVVMLPQPVSLAELGIRVPSGEPVPLAKLVELARAKAPARVLRRDQGRSEIVVVLAPHAEAEEARTKVDAALESLRTSTPNLDASRVR